MIKCVFLKNKHEDKHKMYKLRFETVTGCPFLHQSCYGVIVNKNATGKSCKKHAPYSIQTVFHRGMKNFSFFKYSICSEAIFLKKN